MKRILLLLSIFLCCAFNSLAQERIESKEYEIYKILLGDGYQSVVSKFTIADDIDSVFKNPYRKRDLLIVESQTRKDFNRRNKESYELQDNFDIKPNVKLVTGEDVKYFYEIGRKNDLAAEDAFYKKFGARGFISLSRIGFNKDKTQALVSIISESGFCGTCSTNFIYVYSKKGDVWKEERKVIGWIS